jgi:hypothetical protein
MEMIGNSLAQYIEDRYRKKDSNIGKEVNLIIHVYRLKEFIELYQSLAN